MATAEPTNTRTAASKVVKGCRTLYWGYKIVQGVRVCMGDVTVLVELGAELCVELAAEAVIEGVVEGACELVATNPELIVEAATAAQDVRDGGEEVAKCVEKYEKCRKS